MRKRHSVEEQAHPEGSRGPTVRCRRTGTAISAKNGP